MSAIENIFWMLPDRVSSGKKDQIFTPPHIAEEMVNTLPAEVFNKDTTFLDICCKSGIFLYKIYQKLMESPAMQADFPDETDRAKHIIHKQLFGISPSTFCQMFSTRTVYGYLDPESNIISFGDNYNHVMQNQDKRFLLETLKKEFNMKKFGVVIGNPPYNNDAYLDFVQLGHKLSDKYTMMITPAKHYFLGADENIKKHINLQILRYTERMGFYQCEGEVFKISLPSGVAYYLVGKAETDTIEIKNYSEHFDSFNTAGFQCKFRLI